MNLKNVLKKLWHCEQGFVVSSELVFMSAIIVIGMIVGMATIRDQFVQEYGDTAISIGALNQSYTFSGVVAPEYVPGFGPVGFSPGSDFDDKADFCDVFGFDPKNAEPACINVNIDSHPPTF